MTKTTQQSETSTKIRIGLLVAVSLILAMLIIFFIGSEQKIFSRKNEYKIRLESASGLAEGNPVQLSGVTVGTVSDIRLPRDPKLKVVMITIMIDRKFEERIRTDSRAKLKKLGLIAADSFIDISPGSPQFPVVPPGSMIPAKESANVDQLISSGEDLVDNFLAISYSLKNVLQRVDRGEGLIGELTSQPRNKQKLTDTLLATLNKTNGLLDQVQHGDGLVGKLVYDEDYAREFTGAISGSATSLQNVMLSLQRSFETGQGMIPALLHDPEGKQKVFTLVENLRVTSENLLSFSAAMKNGEGLAPRLLNDKAYGDQTLAEFRQLISRLNDTARKLNEGEGTAGRLIDDPAIYESINDILIGINESKMLRWLVRTQQQKGIEKRFEAGGGKDAPGTQTPPPAPRSKITPQKGPVPPVIPDSTEDDEPPATSTDPSQPPASDTSSPPANAPSGTLPADLPY